MAAAETTSPPDIPPIGPPVRSPPVVESHKGYCALLPLCRHAAPRNRTIQDDEYSPGNILSKLCLNLNPRITHHHSNQYQANFYQLTLHPRLELYASG